MSSNQQTKTKNDDAWERLFEKYQILDHIHNDGQFVISSAQINTVRESRLMAKFDHYVNLPQIFRSNHLSILPISRSQYTIGHFRSYHQLTYDPDIRIVSARLPEGIETINYADLYSETAALICAYNAGIIDDLTGEKTLYTVAGRMSTEKFAFSIANGLNKQTSYHINVDNSQCEVDAGFEGVNHFLLVEAKNYAVDDFLVRQLYYPYRLWLGKLSKRVIPVFMTFSNDIFDFFIYEFGDPEDYNSLKLIQQKRYTVMPESITTADVAKTFSAARIEAEPKNIAFPQADRFDRVVDLLSLLASKDLTKEEITENYAFDIRQTQYYTDAARYLGLAEKYQDPATQAVTFKLTNEARLLFRQTYKVKYLGLIGRILKRRVFYEVFRIALQQGTIPSIEEISQVIITSHIPISGSTVERRASTVRGWIAWIWEQIED